MEVNIMKRIIYLFIVFVIMTNSFYAEQRKAVKDNEKFQSNSPIYNAYCNANRASLKRSMFLTGLILGPVGALFFGSINSKQYPTNFVGKDPGYVRDYLRAYRKYARMFSSRYANMGCAYNILTLTAAYIISYSVSVASH